MTVLAEDGRHRHRHGVSQPAQAARFGFQRRAGVGTGDLGERLAAVGQRDADVLPPVLAASPAQVPDTGTSDGGDPLPEPHGRHAVARPGSSSVSWAVMCRAAVSMRSRTAPKSPASPP